MGKRSRRSEDGGRVSASDLAQMGRCERLVVFEHLHGSRRTAGQQRARERGVIEHEQFYREGLAVIAQADRKVCCFITTATFGKGWLSEVSRRLRNMAVRASVWGPRLSRFYGRVALGTCMARHRWLTLQAPVGMLRGVVTTWHGYWAGWRGAGKCRR